MTPVVWHGCYDESWRDLIVPAAFAHPAKMSRALLVRIYDELFALGALKAGDTVVDPFGGIGTTGIEGASRGVQVICCELEQKFVDLGKENFALHRRDWQAMGRPQPIMVKCDSRTLRNSIGSDVRAMATRSSPPYEGSQVGSGREGRTGFRGYTDIGGGTSATEGQLSAMPAGESVAAMRSSPPYAEGLGHGGNRAANPLLDEKALHAGNRDYGATDGQLAAMRTGDVAAVVSSPPYAEIASGAGGLNTKPAKDGQQGGRSGSSASQDTDQRYGETDGQLARLPKGEVDAVVASPPYEGSLSASADGIHWDKAVREANGGGEHQSKGASASAAYPPNVANIGNLRGGAGVDAVVTSPPWENGADGTIRAEKFKDPLAFARSLSAADGHGTRNATTTESRLAQMERSVGATYGDSPGQMGNQKGETFWSAALLIVQESYAILKPGGVAVWVVKSFVRDRQLVDFPGDWRKLCEYVGFETFQEVHASLVTEEQIPDLFDGSRTKRRERKSFFRRLAEKKGAPAINYEVVLFMVKR